MKVHKHKFERIGYRGYEVIMLYCPCGEHSERKATKAETRKIRREGKEQEEASKRQNKVAYEFDRLFKTYRDGHPYKVGERTVTPKVEDGWKYKGHDFMVRIRKWAKKYPKDVLICGVDDTHFTNSMIVFILHRPSPRKLWGTSCVVITQCDGIPPKEFFMYPGHRKGIQEALSQMAKYKNRFLD